MTRFRRGRAGTVLAVADCNVGGGVGGCLALRLCVGLLVLLLRLRLGCASVPIF